MMIEMLKKEHPEKGYACFHLVYAVFGFDNGAA